MTGQHLTTIPLFEGLSPKERKRIVGALRQKTFKAGDIVFHEGDPGDKLFLVREGLVRIYTGGREKGFETSVILIGKSGDVFGELAIVDGKPRSASAKAMEDTIVYTIANHHFKHHLECIPQLAINFIQQMSNKMRSNTRKINDLASKPVVSRLAILIAKLAEEHGVKDDAQTVINISLNQTQIASMIGATRESTNRAMQQLKQKEIVMKDDGRLRVLNFKELLSLTD